MKSKTFVPDETKLEREWWLVDAEAENLGRLASRVSKLLQGKHRPTYAPHLDMGDHVVIVNADKITWSGQRGKQKKYFRHSGFPGGLRESSLDEMMQRHPERVLRLAIRGMLPRTRLGRRMIGKLKVYAGPDHPHSAQSPRPLEERVGI